MQKPGVERRAPPQPTSAAAQGRTGGAGSRAGSPGRTGGAASPGPGPQHAGPRPHRDAHLARPSGRTGHSGGQQVRPRDDQLPTTKVVTAEPGPAGAPTAQQPSAQPRPPRPPQPAPPAAAPSGARALLDARLRVALLIGLLGGVLLGCALALLSVLDPGLLPAIG